MLESAAAQGHELSMDRLSQRLGVTDRHLRRIFASALGVPPLAYLNTRRLLQAKQMLTDTALPVTEVAHAAGFGSVRRFNAAFSQHYRLSPTGLRQQRGPAALAAGNKLVQVTLGYRPPYDAAGLRRFLQLRAVPGLEIISGCGDAFCYSRSLALWHGGQRRVGWLRVETVLAKPELRVSLSEGLVPAMALVLQRVRQSMDLDADPTLVDPAVQTLGFPPRPGLRLPGAIDGFEAAVRVILGQQVTVAAARTLTARLVEALGEKLPLPEAGVERVFPSAQTVAEARASTIGQLGIVRQRVGALQALAHALLNGELSLDRDAPLEPTLAKLRSLPGIGEWTAQLIAMRALAWPDAFPASDLALLKALGTRDPQEAASRVEACRPWRAYAVMRCWQTLETQDG
jgi:AraC family transcriptional regulator of adaptative response / DNA-3-methyladenine glycosylase II